MERYDKPSVLRQKGFLKIALLALILVVFGKALLGNLGDCIRLPQVLRNAQSVSAVVYNVECGTDSDGDSECDVYIRYHYEGKDYDVCYLSGTKDNSWANRVGESLSVRINPERPDELIDWIENGAGNMAMALGLFNLWLWPAAMPHRKKWTEAYGHDRYCIQQDLKDCVNRRWLWKWGLMTGAELVVLSVVFLGVIPVWNILLGAVLIWLGFKGFKHARTDLQKISNEEFSIREETLTDKYETIDNDCSKEYCLTYTNESGSWSKVVTPEVYQAAQIGQVKRGVYLAGEKTAMLLLTAGETEAV